MYSHQPAQLSNLSRSLPPTPSQLHPSVMHDTEAVPDDYFGESEEVPLPFPIKTIVADPQTGLSLTLISALGAGSYAVVYLAKEVASGTLYALKCLGKNKLTQDEVAIQRNEVDIHMSLPKHRNIVHLFNMFETTQHLFLLMEYASGMDMYQWISTRSDKVDPVSGAPHSPSSRYSVIKILFDQVLEGVGQVHLCGVAHRDLKPENFLIEYVDGQYTVKITDFGLATTDTESDEFECGSKPYMSFECRNGIDKVYNVQQSDLWSLGIILINLLYHRCPWSDPCPQSSYAFSEFLRSRVDFLQKRFEDMPGPVARWLGLRAFAFVGLCRFKRRRTRPGIEDWRSWMDDFVPRMLGEIDTTSEQEEDYDEEEEYREYLALYEDEALEKEVEGEEIIDDAEDDDDDNQVVPITIQQSSFKDGHQSYLDPGRAYASYHVPMHSKLGNAFTSSSAPKFDPSAFYQPARLRQESWSDAIDVEGTEDAEMDFSAPILFEETDEDEHHGNESEDDDDSLGLAVALPDDFIDPLPQSSNVSSGRETPSTPKMTHLNFNTEKRQFPAHLRLELDSLNQQSLQEPSMRSAGRASPAAEINTLVFIEPDTAHSAIDATQNASGDGHASSLPSTSHMEAALGPGSARAKEQAHLKQHMRKPARNLQDVKAAPFVFPPLKTATTASISMADIMSTQLSPSKEKAVPPPTSLSRPQESKDRSGPKEVQKPSTSTDKSNIYIIPKRSQLGPWGAQAAGHQPSRPHDLNNTVTSRNASWRRGHHRGGSWTSTDDTWDTRKDHPGRSGDDGPGTSSGKWRARLEDREDAQMGLPPRVENKFRPRYRQGRRFAPNANTATLPPAPPMPQSNSSGPRSRHQSRSGAVLDASSGWGNHGPVNDTFKDQPQQQDQAPQPKYQNSQLRMQGKGSLGSSSLKLAGQRNKSLVDLRAAVDPTNQSWRQPVSSGFDSTIPSSQAPSTISKARSQSGAFVDSGQRKGANGVHPLEQSSSGPLPFKSKLTDRLTGTDGESPGDNIYHPPHWHERKSSSSSVGSFSKQQSRRLGKP